MPLAVFLAAIKAPLALQLTLSSAFSGGLERFNRLNGPFFRVEAAQEWVWQQPD
jgi:hypothetical protein